MATINKDKTFFWKLVKEKTGVASIAELARTIGRDYLYTYSVLTGEKVSRKLILQIAELYHVPDLLYFYEKFIQERVENKSMKPIKNLKEGGVMP